MWRDAAPHRVISIPRMTRNSPGFVFAGIVLPPVLALLFVRYWKRWQFTLVWLGYIVLLAWDVLMALFITGLLVKGGIRTWL